MSAAARQAVARRAFLFMAVHLGVKGLSLPTRAGRHSVPLLSLLYGVRGGGETGKEGEESSERRGTQKVVDKADGDYLTYS